MSLRFAIFTGRVITLSTIGLNSI